MVVVEDGGADVVVVVEDVEVVDDVVEDGVDVVDVVEDGVDVVDVVDDVDGVAGATPVSGETHPAGGAVAPDWPGISTVPAHPKSEKVASLELDDPSAKWAVDWVWRMNPDASMETSTVEPVYPWAASTASEAVIACDSSEVSRGTSAAWAGVMDSA